MIIYQSNYINIDFKNDIFFQTWSGLEITEKIFKIELKNFLKVFLEFRPKKLLWDNRKFNLFISEELNLWVEKEILIPQYENGLLKLAFIVTSDIMIQQTVIKSVESFKPYLKPHFFLTKTEALKFLNDIDFQALSVSPIANLNIEQIPNNNYQLKIKIQNNNLKDTIVALREIVKFQDYRNSYQNIYDSLTTKEKIIIRQMVYGKTSKQIADLLYIQPETIGTHRKNLKRKINYRNNFELIYFAKAFGIISF